mgnify:CR=1 FL=1
MIATAALATLLAACSNDSDVFNTPDYTDTPIGLNVNVARWPPVPVMNREH